jgi:hypothetical protein
MTYSDPRKPIQQVNSKLPSKPRKEEREEIGGLSAIAIHFGKYYK